MIENGYKCHSLIIKVKTKIVEVTKMNTSEVEKEWLRRMIGEQRITERRSVSVPKERLPKKEETKKGRGFGDIAGMNELKEFVTSRRPSGLRKTIN